MNEQTNNNTISQEARNFVKKKKNWQKIVKHFADTTKIPPSSDPISFFMAGSPGAGKTEISRALINMFPNSIVHIDTDEVRSHIPQYNGSNSSFIHGAASLAVEKIMDQCLRQNQSFIFDAMFSDFDKAKDNVQRCLKRNRSVVIFYVYQDPKLAWDFTKAREEKEGRNIPKEAFIKGFCDSRVVSQGIKDVFKQDVRLHVVQKDFENENEEIFWDVDDIDKHLVNRYSRQDLKDLI